MAHDTQTERLQLAGDDYVEQQGVRCRPAQPGEVCTFCLGKFEPGELIDVMFEAHLGCLFEWRDEREGREP